MSATNKNNIFLLNVNYTYNTFEVGELGEGSSYFHYDLYTMRDCKNTEKGYFFHG